MIKISVIIPTKNGAATLQNCLDGIFTQTLVEELEVIIIDSGSTDNSLDIIKKYPVKLYEIPAEEFNHGETRNYGVSLAKGEFVVMTVQDAVPTDNKWLEKLLKNFEDQEVIGVCGHQIIPHSYKTNPAQWFRPYSEPKFSKYRFKDKSEFYSLSAEKQREYSAWENITAAYRKEILVRYPFEKTITAEDLIWAKKILCLGFGIVYDYNASVFHYHHESFYSLFKRLIIELYIDYIEFGLIKHNNNSLIKRILTAAYLIQKSKVGLFGSIKWFYYNLKLIFTKDLAINIFLFSIYLKKEKGPEWLFSKFGINFPIGKTKR